MKAALLKPTAHIAMANPFANQVDLYKIISSTGASKYEAFSGFLDAYVLPAGQSFPQPTSNIPNADLTIGNTADLPLHEQPRHASYYLLDAASALCTRALEVKAGDRILDMCAAPGGKTLAMAFAMLPEEMQRARDLAAERDGMASGDEDEDEEEEETAAAEGKDGHSAAPVDEDMAGLTLSDDEEGEGEGEDQKKKEEAAPQPAVQPPTQPVEPPVVGVPPVQTEAVDTKKEKKDDEEDDEDEEGEQEGDEQPGRDDDDEEQEAEEVGFTPADLTAVGQRRTLLVANEMSNVRRARLRGVLKSYLPAELASYVQITGHDATAPSFAKANAASFDKVLLDAPCSSDRHVMADPGELAVWSVKRTKQAMQRQIALVSNAIRVLKRGGRLVYSTCSLSPAENDHVVAKFVANSNPKGNKRAAQLKPVPLSKLGFSFPYGAKTKYGLMILPDTTGWGPLYVSVLEKL